MATIPVAGADGCLGCHDEEEPFPTLELFATVHGHPAIAGTPFAMDAATSPPGGLQCESCHGPAGQHDRRMLPDGVRREPMLNFGQRGNATPALQNALCLACHETYERAHWLGSAHEEADLGCADCHRLHADTDPVRVPDMQGQVCGACHGSVLADALKRSSHPMRQGQLICRDCHDPTRRGRGGAGPARRRERGLPCLPCREAGAIPLGASSGRGRLPHMPRAARFEPASVAHAASASALSGMPFVGGPPQLGADGGSTAAGSGVGVPACQRLPELPFRSAWLEPSIGCVVAAMKARRCCPFGRWRVAVALLGVAVTGMAAFGEAFSADYSKARTDRWRCRLCPFDDAFRREGIVTAGMLAVGDSQPRFGRDNGLDRAGSYADVAVDARYSDKAGRIASVQGTDLGLDARQLRMRLADPRAGAAALQWREVPRNVAVDGRTPYVSDGDGSLSLPADWTRAYDTAEMTGLGLAPSFRLATHRRRLGADWRFEPSPGWRLHADYLRETKRGTEETGADFLYQAAILPKPVEYRTETFGVRASFQAHPLLLAVEAREARFANAKPALTWESAYPGPVPVGRKSLAPSNALRTLSWTARSALGRTSFHTRLSWSRGHQDEAFVSGAAGDVVAGSPLPAPSLDGHIHGFVGSVRAVSRVTERLATRCVASSMAAGQPHAAPNLDTVARRLGGDAGAHQPRAWLRPSPYAVTPALPAAGSRATRRGCFEGGTSPTGLVGFAARGGSQRRGKALAGSHCPLAGPGRDPQGLAERPSGNVI